ncbi:putative two-component histidine kinase [Flavihumibacter petaseus NBRC 106054]|uniref:histidine kinase n=2 Tax=Flavihumibacter TaxID=1004301 RepID=A0A0E9MZQ5_9BACT|nr:putative two-component histidine kinase [Flavihumibacter petaseus NBRC 106054]
MACRQGPVTAEASMPDDYAIPVTRPFVLPAAKPIPWREYGKDSVPTPTVIRFDINKLPSKPFSVNDFRPLKQPLRVTAFDWHKLQVTPLKADTMHYQPVPYKKFLLPEPEVTLAATPAILGKGTAGLTRLGPSEGLPGAKVYAAVQDNDGNTWISTDRGICKYTGTEFLAYNFLVRDESGAVEVVSEMMTDSNGKLLVSALKSGIYRIDTKTNMVEQYAVPTGFVRFDFDKQGRLWGTRFDNGVSHLDLDKKQLGQLALGNDSNEVRKVYAVRFDKAGNMWVGANDRVLIVDPALKSMRTIGAAEDLKVNVVYDFTTDSTGRVWLSSFSNGGGYAISLAAQQVTHMGAEQGVPGIVYDVVNDNRNRLWIVTNDTVYLYDIARARMKKMYTNCALRTNNFPSSGTRTRDGMLWLGTNAEGVVLINPDGMLADHFTDRDGLESNDVWGVEEDNKGRIWMATYKGVNIYDPEKERLSLLKLPEGVGNNANRHINFVGPDKLFLSAVGGFSLIDIAAGTIRHYNTAEKELSNTNFRGVPDGSGGYWYCSANGIFRFDPEKRTLKGFNQAAGLVSNLVLILRKDNQGRIWLCTERGAVIIFPEKDTYVNLTDADGLASSYSSMLFQGSDEQIYVGNDRGLSMFDPELKTITQIGADNGMVPSAMYDMTEWHGRLNIGTENGITIVERPTKPGERWRFHNYDKSAGFPYNDYNQSTAIPDSRGNVWWGASPILTVVHQYPVIDSTEPAVRIRGMNIMDQPSSFVNTATLQPQLSPGDSLWVGTKSFAGDKLPADSGYLAKNNIHWDSIRSGFQVPEGLELPYNQNSFAFSFTNQDTRSRDKIVYRFMLEGEDESWSDITKKPASRIYYNVKPGDYQFKVITRGQNGVWSKPDTISFTILPPWWQTWWAYLLYAVTAAAIVYTIVRVRSEMLKKENRILERKVAERTLALYEKMEELKATQGQLVHSEKMASLGELTAGIAHEIQNPLNFINNFAEVNKELLVDMQDELNKGDVDAAKEIAANIDANESKIYHHGRRADAIVKSMLQHSRGNANAVKEATEINKLADEYLRLAYHGLRAKDSSFNATMKTEFDEKNPQAKMVPQDIGRVVLNLLTNAFYAVTEKKKEKLPGYEPTVTVSTKSNKDRVEITVADNGNGIPAKVMEKIFQPFFTTKPTGQGTGLGLSMSYDIVTKGHGGELKVNSREGEGTQFSVILPI